MSIDEINELRQTISIMAFLEVTWKDRFLVWEPFEYSNITSINVKVKDIWTPDIVLRRTLDKQSDFIDADGHAVIYSDGRVIMWPYGRYTVSCKIFITLTRNYVNVKSCEGTQIHFFISRETQSPCQTRTPALPFQGRKAVP